MKTLITATAIATLTLASSALANPEATACGIDPALVVEYSGYAGKQGVFYDRGDYFFTFTNERFLNKISYKHQNNVEAITNHYRIYKDDCRMSDIEIVHTESKPIPVEVPVPVVVEVVEEVVPAPVEKVSSGSAPETAEVSSGSAPETAEVSSGSAPETAEFSAAPSAPETAEFSAAPSAPVQVVAAAEEVALPTNYDPEVMISSLEFLYAGQSLDVRQWAANNLLTEIHRIYETDIQNNAVTKVDQDAIRNSLTIRTENTNPNSAERLRREAQSFVQSVAPDANLANDLNDRHFEVYTWQSRF